MSDPDAGAAGIPDAGSGIAGDESMARRTRRGVLGLVSVMVVYYAVPVGELPSGAGVVFSVLGLRVASLCSRGSSSARCSGWRAATRPSARCASTA